MNRDSIIAKEKEEMGKELDKLLSDVDVESRNKVLKALANYLSTKDDPEAESYSGLGYATSKFIKYYK